MFLFKRGVDAAVDDEAPEEGENDGAGEQEVEEGDFNLSDPEGKAKTEWSRISEMQNTYKLKKNWAYNYSPLPKSVKQGYYTKSTFFFWFESYGNTKPKNAQTDKQTKLNWRQNWSDCTLVLCARCFLLPTQSKENHPK